eukprot:CAMPEP_0177633444 /NCGR_PEP_ID=MMETSP0447-20121125/2840_1 /TAXON_ID=0 /ORGANISM="Stygamoeba regulata, Strain BSH-02190019" /LENGTH=334 /DNA_ID=CAMNT_0019135103 /DNA_START=129 /DNA_END=1133 /DNA_ORIENTATION=-
MWLPTRLDHLRVIGVVVGWVVLNILLNFMNKILFRVENFRFPLAIILTGLLFNLVCTGVCIWNLNLDTIDFSVVKRHWPGIVMVGCAYGLSTGFENLSLLYMDISLNQIVKSSTPVLVMIFSVLIEKKTYTARQVFLLLLITAGVIFTVFETPSIPPNVMFGIALALGSSMCAAFTVVFSAKLLANSTFGPLALNFLLSPPGTLILLPIFIKTEAHNLFYTSTPNQRYDVAAMLLIGFLGFVYHIFQLLIVKYTSSIYSQLVACLKNVIIICLSIVIFRDTPLNIMNSVGMALVIVCFSMYTLESARLREAAAAKAAEAQGEYVTLGEEEMDAL